MKQKLKTAIMGLALLMAFAPNYEAQSLPGIAAKPASYFYTGKPYDVDLNTYKFNDRDYNPEVNQWTTIDPSGFPDGANNYRYVVSPTSQIDYQGCFTLSATAPSIRKAYDPTHKYYAEAYDIVHVGANSAMQGTLSSLLATDYPSYHVNLATNDLSGGVNVQQYVAANQDRNSRSNGALKIQTVFSQAPSGFTWFQIGRARLFSDAQWQNWFVDTTGFGAPRYNSSTDPTFSDWPTLGPWEHKGGASGASKEYYTFAAIKNGNTFTVYDGFSWGGIVKE